jgi:hypothetical protein
MKKLKIKGTLTHIDSSMITVIFNIILYSLLATFFSTVQMKQHSGSVKRILCVQEPIHKKILTMEANT